MALSPTKTCPIAALSNKWTGCCKRVELIKQILLLFNIIIIYECLHPWFLPVGIFTNMLGYLLAICVKILKSVQARKKQTLRTQAYFRLNTLEWLRIRERKGSWSGHGQLIACKKRLNSVSLRARFSDGLPTCPHHHITDVATSGQIRNQTEEIQSCIFSVFSSPLLSYWPAYLGQTSWAELNSDCFQIMCCMRNKRKS